MSNSSTTHNDPASSTTGATDASQTIPPPPGATNTQLQLWKKVLARRRRQILSLQPSNFQLYVKGLALDLEATRFDNKNRRDADNSPDNNDDDGCGGRVDLAVGSYSRLLITKSPPPQDLTIKAVVLHVLGLFYRSLDNRLSLDQRNHGLELVKKAFLSLDETLEQQKHSEKTGSEAPSANSIVNGSSQRQREDDNNDHQVPQNKRARIEATENVLATNKNNTAAAASNVAKSATESTKKNIPARLNGSSTQNQTLPQSSSQPVESAPKPQPTRSIVIKTILPPSPNPLPPPQPFRQITALTFIPDNNSPSLMSASLDPRPACTLTYNSGYESDGTGGSLNDKLVITVRERLETWDPYWKVVDELGLRDIPGLNAMGQSVWTRVGTKTSACVPSPQGGAISNPPVSCAMVSIDLARELQKSRFDNHNSSSPWGIEWGKHLASFNTGDRRLLVRTLPLKRTAYDIKKRADTHLWPKGTFIQFSQVSSLIGSTSEQVLRILQRRQQSHDYSLWKGMSHALDLSTRISNTQAPFQIKLCSREYVGGDGDSISEKQNGILTGSYAIQVAICEYVSPDDLYDRVTGKIPGGDFVIPIMPLDMARAKAKGYLENQTVSIVDSDDEDEHKGNSSGDDNCLTFSLLCPISKSAMETPVRGQDCKHMQCFDLRNFLHANKTISGGRWRCGVCEEFVSVRGLVRCGLFQAMLDDLREDVSGIRDRVSLKPDGTWSLLSENKLRYANKTGGDASAEGNINEAGVAAAEKKKPAAEPEVIDLL